MNLGKPWSTIALAHRLKDGPATLQPAIVFDRDGVLIADTGYLHRRDQVEWLPGAFDAVRLLNDLGWWVFVATNQSGIARGLYGEAELRDLHGWMAAEMARHDTHIDAFAYCPHHPEAVVARYRQSCRCRKPAPGMIDALLAAWPVDRTRSLLIGDRQTDIAAGRTAGLKAYRFSGGDLRAFVQDVLSRHSGSSVENSAAAKP